MVKKLITLALGLLLGAGLMAQSSEATISSSDIKYWVGSGESQAILILDDGTNAVAWGYLFDEDDEPTAFDMVSAIDKADPRFSYTISYDDWLFHYFYCGYPVKINLAEDDVRFKVNGTIDDEAETSMDIDLEPGMIIKISDSDEDNWNTSITAVGDKAMPADSTIAKSDVKYWVGSGANEAVIIINYSGQGKALAWGVRWDGDLNFTEAMQKLCAADPRLRDNLNYTWSYAAACPMYEMSYSQWHIGSNHWAGYDTDLSDGDYVYVGDPSVAVGFDSTYSYGGWWPAGVVWQIAVEAVEEPAEVMDACTSFSDIQYWVGEGSNRAMLIVSWQENAFAWGYRYDGNQTVADMMNAVAAADWRFSYEGTSFVSDIFFNDGEVDLHKQGAYWLSITNGVSNMGLSTPLSNGDIVKWGDVAGAVALDSTWMEYGEWSYWDYTYAWPIGIIPVSSPDKLDASIAFDKVALWAGQGSNRAVLIVNWADTALAWGYRFSEEKASVSAMMDAVAQLDSRFSYTAGGGYLSDIFFARAEGDTLRITVGNYWEGLNNGIGGGAGLSESVLPNAYYKWGDPASGTAVDSVYYDGWGWLYSNVWSNNVYPATVEQPKGEFCGPVGSEGCDAIAVTDSRIVAWAAGCTVVRGPQDIAVEGSPATTTGKEENAVGAATESDVQAVVSLGDGGMATLTFANPIKNGEGPDFAVFENGFSDTYLELAFVEVSSDGERFVRFPAVSLTQTVIQTDGFSSTDATMLNNLAGKYRIGYGTPFDLDELKDSTGLDVNNITHVRIVDVVGSINPAYGTRDSRGNLINDPYPTNNPSGGFDLTGVAVLNSAVGISDVVATTVSLYPNPTTDRLTISGARGQNVMLFSVSGQLISAFTLMADSQVLDLSGLPAGSYLLRVGTESHRVVKQ